MSDDCDGVLSAVDKYEPYRRESPGDFGSPPPDPSRGGLPGWRLRRVVDFMTEHLARDIDVDELVTRCGLSRAQFFRAFRQSTGQTPHRYLVDLRLVRARLLLETTDLSIADVSRQVGMGSNAGFARLFHGRFGDQPSRYRRSFHAANGSGARQGLAS